MERLDSADDDTLAALPPPPPDLNLWPLVWSECQFWWHFAKWPVAFAVMNFVESWVVGVLFDDGGESNVVYSSLFSLLWMFDAWLLYRASNFVKKQTQAWNVDEEGRQDGVEQVDSTTTPLLNNSHGSRQNTLVHAQVSQRLDALLGRTRTGNSSSGRNRSSTSILVSLLLLGSVACVTISAAIMANCAFMTTIGRKVCGTWSDRQEDIPGIPQELQEWAKADFWMDSIHSQDAVQPFVHLDDGSTFVVTTIERTPDPNATSSLRKDTGGGPRMIVRFVEPELPDSVLVAIPPSANGKLQVLADVAHPRSFLILSDDPTVDSSKVPGFCCLYNEKTNPEVDEKTAPSDPPLILSIMCYCGSSSDRALLFENGQVRNATVSRGFEIVRRHHVSKNMVHATMKWHANAIWIKLQHFKESHVVREYYNMSVLANDGVTSLPLELTPVANDAIGRSCGQWASYLLMVPMVATWIPASYWLVHLQRLPVGVVPAFGALVAVLGAVVHYILAVVACYVMAGVALLALLGYHIIPLWMNQWDEFENQEALVWILYSSMAGVALSTADASYGEVYAGWALGMAVVAGALLGHPTLYLIGWIGGVGCVLFGTIASLLDTRFVPWVVIGAIGGAGCVTVGRLLYKYHAYLRFYSKRAWTTLKDSIALRTMGH